MTVKGVKVECIQVFRDHVLVQEIESKMIYLVEYSDFDTFWPTEEKSVDSNIISLKGWKTWRNKQKQTKTANRLSAKSADGNPKAKKQPKIRLLTALT